jgi:hypothetical protein
MQVRYQVMWDNRVSPKWLRNITKEQSAAAPKGVPQVVGDVQSSDNGLFGSVNFGPGERRVAAAVAKELRKQGYLGVSVWDTHNNPLSNMFKL